MLANMEEPLVKFLENRSQELLEIQQSLESNNDKRQLKMKGLPYYLRRRAKSHNIKRLPKRLHNSQIKKTIGAKKSKCPPSKHRKRLRNYAARQKDKTWLETHIWHAKRFKMTTLWGYKIAMQPTAKSEKAAQRAAKSASIILDISYMNCIEIQGPEDHILTALPRIIPGFSVTNQNYLQETEHLFYKVDQHPRDCLGPVKIMRNPSPFKFWLWCHPSITIAVITQLEAVFSDGPQVNLSRIELNRHRHIGPASLTLLQRVLQTDSNFSQLNKLWETGMSVSEGTVLTLNVFDPRFISPSQRREKQFPIASNSEPQTVSPEDIPVSNVPHLWDESVRKTATESKIPDFKVHELRSNTQMMDVDSLEQKPLVPVFVIRTRDGYDAIYPKDWSMPFWIASVYSEARAFGLREHKRVFSQPFFPDHFPETEAGRDYEASITKLRLEEFNKRPPAKRPNYSLLGIKTPFVYDWQTIVGEGNPVSVVRDKEVLRSLQDYLNDKSLPFPQLESESLIPVTLKANPKGTLEPYAAILLPGSNEEIGYVQEGSFCYDTGVYRGFGHMKSSALLHLSPSNVVSVKPHHCDHARDFCITVVR